MPLNTLHKQLKSEDIFGLLGEINREENLEDALKILTKRSLDYFNCSMSGIWLWQGDGFQPLASSARTDLQERFLTYNLLPMDFKVFIKRVTEGHAVIEREMMLHEVNNSDSNLIQKRINCFAEWEEDLNKFNIQRIFCVPLLHFGQLLGVLLLFSEDPNSFDEESVYWLEQLMPILSSNVYEQQLRIAAVEREQSLSLLLRGTEILVKADSEQQLLAEAGEMAMEILYLEAGFFHMQVEGTWTLQAPFGRLKQFESVWQEWIKKDKQR